MNNYCRDAAQPRPRPALIYIVLARIFASLCGRGFATSLLLILLLYGSNHRAALSREFKPALPGYVFSFPKDHGAHEDYKTEWWYYTGHLIAKDQRRFGYELTFFRTGVDSSTEVKSPWNVADIYLAHFAVTDEANRRFYFFEKLNRAGLNTAGARSDHYGVFNENWSVEQLGDHYILKADAPKFALHLILDSVKPPVVHGHDGISQKASCKGCASHYYSMTRLKSDGYIYVNDDPIAVTGTAWMDHEFGSNQLTSEQVGWDWYSVQLDNNTELMLYMIRKNNGQIDLNSSGTVIYPDGHIKHLNLADFKVKSKRVWKSSQTGGAYPMDWTIAVPSEKVNLEITPSFDDQELRTGKSTGVIYWEGAASVKGLMDGKSVGGQAYVEMTGYAEKFKKEDLNMPSLNYAKIKKYSIPALCIGAVVLCVECLGYWVVCAWLGPHFGSKDVVKRLGKAVKAGHLNRITEELDREEIELFTTMIETYPKNTRLYQGRAHFYGELNQYQNAADDFSKVISVEPKNESAYSWRGYYYSRLGKEQNVIDDYSKVISLNPKNESAYTWRGSSYCALGQYQKAIDDYSTAIALDPKNGLDYAWRGYFYLRLRQHQKAIDDLSKGISLDPKVGWYYTWRASSYRALGQNQKAIDDYSTAIALDNEHGSDYSERGSLYELVGQHQKAVDDLSKAISLDSKDGVALARRGYCQMQLGQYQKAADDCSKSIALSPKFAWPYYARGSAYAKLGQYQKAVDDYSKTISFDPECKHAVGMLARSMSVYQLRSEAYDKLGKHDLAEKDRRAQKNIEKHSKPALNAS